MVLGDTKRRIKWLDQDTPIGTYLCNYGEETHGCPDTAQAIVTINAVTYDNMLFKTFTYITVATGKMYTNTYSTTGGMQNWVER